MYVFLLILIVVSYCRDFFSLIFEQSHCISNCSFFQGVDLLLPWALGKSFPWNMSWSTGYFVLFFSLQSHKCPKGVDKELEFCVTTIREFCLCFLSLYLLEITENHTTILVTQFPCLVEEWEVSFGLGFALFSGWLTRRCCPYLCLCCSHAFDLGSTYIDFYTLLRPSLLLLQGILRNDSSKDKLQQSKLTLIVLLKINSEKGFFNRR